MMGIAYKEVYVKGGFGVISVYFYKRKNGEEKFGNPPNLLYNYKR